MSLLTVFLTIVAVTIMFDIVFTSRLERNKVRTAKRLFDLNNEIRDAAQSGDTAKMQSSLNEYENVLHKMGHRFTNPLKGQATEIANERGEL